MAHYGLTGLQSVLHVGRELREWDPSLLQLALDPPFEGSLKGGSGVGIGDIAVDVGLPVLQYQSDERGG